MSDSRLYALLQLLRTNGVDVAPGFEWEAKWGWHRKQVRFKNTDIIGVVLSDARAAIVVGCMEEAKRIQADIEWQWWSFGTTGNFRLVGKPPDWSITYFPDTPNGWLLAVAHARGIAVPAELKGASDE